ncbi:hypothetical protein Ciccas_013629, partial [Cichlidogyrus casuarinus]
MRNNSDCFSAHRIPIKLRYMDKNVAFYYKTFHFVANPLSTGAGTSIGQITAVTVDGSAICSFRLLDPSLPFM